MLDELTAADFRPHVATSFAVADGGGTEAQSLVLDEVDEGPEQPDAPRRVPFALVFSGDGPPLDQRIHALQHAVLGRLELFLVPIQPGPGGRPRYEAVFN